ncbi:MAG: leucine-rich repeat domain-containing protein, partial [Clostridiales bacterium]|nr:leucine-rich repeat domain-containing protein [Clostridiales bacterium]
VNIEIPAGVTSIGEGAFRDCDSLVSIEIPASVTSIGGDAFGSCARLRSVTMNSVTPPGLGILAFYNTPDDMKIYVPSGSEDTYKSASGWSSCASKITVKP